MHRLKLLLLPVFALAELLAIFIIWIVFIVAGIGAAERLMRRAIRIFPDIDWYRPGNKRGKIKVGIEDLTELGHLNRDFLCDKKATLRAKSNVRPYAEGKSGIISALKAKKLTVDTGEPDRVLHRKRT